jgi:uncharacterized protein YdeI (BOF family)
MKLTRIIPVVALATLAMLASCKSGNKTDANANANNGAATETPAAAPAKSQDEINLEKATTLKGWIKAIAGDVVTIVDANGNETQVKVVNAYDELIEGAPIEVKFIDDNGTKKTATGDNKSLSLPQNYKKLLGKWVAKDGKTTFELRKSGKVKTSLKTNFLSWRVKDDKTIQFEIKGENGSMFSDWNVDTIDDEKLTLSNGQSKFELDRKDRNRE